MDVGERQMLPGRDDLGRGHPLALVPENDLLDLDSRPRDAGLSKTRSGRPDDMLADDGKYRFPASGHALAGSILGGRGRFHCINDSTTDWGDGPGGLGWEMLDCSIRRVGRVGTSLSSLASKPGNE